MTNNAKYPDTFSIHQLLKLEKGEVVIECNTKALELAKFLIANKISISFAESITGGLLMSQLVKTAGISSVLKGGVVCYKPESKQRLLNIPSELIQKHSCESTRISTAMAEGIMEITNSKIAVGITGLASEGASQSESKPIGSVFLSIIYKGIIYQTKTLIKGNRSNIRYKASTFCIEQILKILKMVDFQSSNSILKRSITTKGRRIINYIAN